MITGVTHNLPAEIAALRDVSSLPSDRDILVGIGEGLTPQPLMVRPIDNDKFRVVNLNETRSNIVNKIDNLFSAPWPYSKLLVTGFRMPADVLARHAEKCREANTVTTEYKWRDVRIVINKGLKIFDKVENCTAVIARELKIPLGLVQRVKFRSRAITDTKSFAYTPDRGIFLGSAHNQIVHLHRLAAQISAYVQDRDARDEDFIGLDYDESDLITNIVFERI